MVGCERETGKETCGARTDGFEPASTLEGNNRGGGVQCLISGEKKDITVMWDLSVRNNRGRLVFQRRTGGREGIERFGTVLIVALEVYNRIKYVFVRRRKAVF